MRILVRLDDFTPNRNVQGWTRITAILDRWRIRPLVAVVPRDRYFGSADSGGEFWQEVRQLQARGWSIGLHGLTHLVEPIAPGAAREIFFATKSEFVGLPQQAQLQLLATAWDIFSVNGVQPVAFVAPNHGFDAATVQALVEHGRMRYIADGISLRLFADRGLYWLPQIDWRIPRLFGGFRTVCLHPSTLSEGEIRRFEASAQRMAGQFVGFDEIAALPMHRKGLPDALFAAGFRVYFRVKEALHGMLSNVRVSGDPAQ